VLFVLYLMLLLYLTLVFQTERRVARRDAVNLVPFRTLVHFAHSHVRVWDLIVNIPGNVLALAPLGILLPLVTGARWSARSIALAGFALSFSIEVAQYLSGRRIADIDDVILNTLGAVLGYWLLRASCRFAGRAGFNRRAVLGNEDARGNAPFGF
jgi:glycopeptide antibiotics resistance protein